MPMSNALTVLILWPTKTIRRLDKNLYTTNTRYIFLKIIDFIEELLPVNCRGIS
jgi:hypothetical protein